MTENSSMSLRKFSKQEKILPERKLSDVEFCNIAATNRKSIKRTPNQSAAFGSLQSCASTDENANIRTTNNMGFLQELCGIKKITQPFYRQLSQVGPPHQRRFTFACEIDSLVTQATSNSKKQAKRLCAEQMIKKIEGLIQYEEQINDALRNNLFDEKETFRRELDKRTKIINNSNYFQRFMRRKHLTPKDFEKYWTLQKDEGLKAIFGQFRLSYSLIQIQGPPKVIVAFDAKVDIPFTVLGLGSTKEEAEKNAVERAVKTLKSYIDSVDC